jgi:multiple sugar transport system ATP-binding protein
MSSVAIEKIEKSYGAEPVLRGVSLDVPDGEFVVLVGPSGCGKSTLLRLIAGLEEIQGGTITLGSRLINSVPPRDRDIAMVFQNYALYPHMTVRENMAFSLKLRGADKQERERAVLKSAEILNLEPYLDRYPRQLSGGQRQRVAMGRAIVRDPQLFLFDEPLSNLDAKLRVQMRAEIKELHQRLRTTSIYVTHDQIEAMTMADRVVVMNGGRVEQVGAPLEIYDRPENLFVAGFIGSPTMNFVDVTVRHDNGLAKAFTEDGTMLPLPARRVFAEGQTLVYGIRPEHVEITEDGANAELLVIEPTGPETLLYIAFAGAHWNVLTRERPAARPGDRLSLSPQPERIHLFDKQSGRRLDD